MNKTRNISIIIIFVVILALAIQLTRSDFVFVKQKNTSFSEINESNIEIKALPEDEINRKERDNYNIVIDTDDVNSSRIKDQIANTLRLMKKDFKIQDVKISGNVDTDASAVIICTRKLENVLNMDEVVNYVNDGGCAFFAVAPDINGTYYRIYRKLGIEEGPEKIETEGIKLVSNILLKGKGEKYGEDFIKNTSIAVTLDKKCRVHATDLENIPIMWDITYGKGSFMVFNGTMLNEKRSRGLITGAVSIMKSDYIYPILNLKVVFIDDFPAPFPEGFNKEIFEKYGRSTKVFFRDVWWPDMLRLMASYDIKYTGAIIRTYDDRVSPPFPDVKESDSLNLVLYGREILRNGGEMGIHGYNHQSLVIAGDPKEKYASEVLKYKIYKDEEAVVKSLKAFEEYFKTYFKDYALTCYVPPSNLLGDSARKVMKKALPKLETISSAYYNNLENGVYEQEFEIAEDGILEFPRLTYGFAKDELNYWALLNGVSGTGVLAHFCHPDDVLDEERSAGKSWDELFKDFEAFFKKSYNNYPWLRGMTVTKAGREARKVLSSKTFIDYRDNEILGYINGLKGDYYFVLRTDKEAFAAKNCKVEMIDDGVYLVCVKDMTFTVGLRR